MRLRFARKRPSPRVSRLLPMTPAPRSRLGGRRALALCGGTALLALAPLALDLPLRLMWNASASVPRGFYRVTDERPRVGDLAVVHPPGPVARFMARRRYVPLGVPLLKPVAATMGARVCRTDAVVTIDGRRAARALAADRIGRALPRWSGCRTLGAGDVFLLAPASASSFDSRYFGAVPADAIAGRATPVWTIR